MTNKEIRRFFTTGRLTESYSSTKDVKEAMSVAEAFEDLDRLYEADEETTKNEAEPKVETKDAEQAEEVLADLKDAD